MRLIYLSILLIFSFFFSGCDDNTLEEDPFSRTLMIYLGRDNSDLSFAHEDKLSAMLDGWDGKGGNLVVYEDKRDELPCLMEVYREAGTNKTRILYTYEEENSARGEVFGRAVRDMKSLYPADSYGMIFFSHGSGWLPESTLNSPRSIGRDGTDEMELTEFAAAIPDRTFDFIVFEVCLMAGIEVAYELKDKSSYILVSAAEIVSPGFIEVYKTDINRLFKKEPDLHGFAESAFDWNANAPASYNSSTLSIIRTAGLNPLLTWMKSHVEDLHQEVDLSKVQDFYRSSTYLFLDFEDYFSYLLPESLHNEFSSLIRDCVEFKAATPSFLLSSTGFIIEKHCGLTTYVMQEKYPYLNEKYKDLSWYKALYE